MALGDGIRRNIASVDPIERALLRDALIASNQRLFPGSRTDPIPGGVSWWFKQDETHQATHVHGTPEFVPWHRELVNRLEGLLRQIDPRVSLHYWDWTQDPRAIPNANLGNGTTGTLNLFTTSFMGYGGSSSAPIGQPWLNAGYYVPGASLHRDATGNPADPPNTVVRFVAGSPATVAQDNAIVNAVDYPTMWPLLKNAHDAMHGFVAMGGIHTSFRDPFVFLLHSNVDRLFARWQTDLAHPDRLVPSTVYGTDSGDPGLNSNISPWSGVPPTTRPWAPPENQQMPHTYKHPSIVTPPLYDVFIGGGAQRIASGRTTPGATAWQVYSPTGIYVDVNTTAGKFSAPPVYIPSIGGTSSHWATTGATSVYSATATGFRVYVKWSDNSPLTPAQANGNQWHINWLGMEI
jgi:hypothetical protein